MPDFDFGFNGNTSANDTTVNDKPADNVTDIETGEKVDENGNPVTDLTPNDKETSDDNANNNSAEKDKDSDANKDNSETSEASDDKLEVGTIIEYENKKYTINQDGDLVDDGGKVFKKADKVNDWLKSLDTETTEDVSEAVVDVKAVQKALGVEIQDENGKPIEYENTAEGVASYVRAYVENAQQQIADATIDMLYAKYPVIEDVINYYVANGNSLKGFNELRDRSTIELDVNNEAQCEAIIREAWKENKRGGNVENYIQYLKSQNLLGATAKEELDDMIKQDKAAKEKLAKEADEKEKADIEAQKKYWGDINKRVIIDKRIGKYQIPETIIRTKNGQRISATPQDFYNYIYQVDKNGRSAYENDLLREANENPEARIVDDMIAAYLKFTGGNYESLVNMAINEQKVKTIKIKSKTAPKTKPIVTKPTANKDKTIDFGY